jgi:hypothetical protein
MRGILRIQTGDTLRSEHKDSYPLGGLTSDTFQSFRTTVTVGETHASD